MRTILPYPLLFVFLVLMCLSLNRFSLGHLVRGSVIALLASAAMSSLRPDKPRLKKIGSFARLLALVFYDIILSNLSVASQILNDRKGQRKPGFMTIPLEMKNPTGLAVLAVLLTSTPGTAWLEYNSTESTLLIHILDLKNEEEWLELIKNRYERMLMEVFE
mgnify:FL=1